MKLLDIKKKIAALTLIFLSVFSFLFFTSSTVSSDSSEYPSITTKFDVDNMSKYNEEDLFESVTLKNFYVIGLTTDHVHQYRMVLVPKPSSNQYFYMTAKKHKKIQVGQKTTIKGELNGRLEIPNDEWNKNFPSQVLNKQSTMVLVDSYK